MEQKFGPLTPVLTISKLGSDELSKDNKDYLNSHPEIAALLNDFALSMCFEKPKNPIDFAKTYFTKSKKTSFKPLVVCGPSGVGKGTLIGMLFKEFPNLFSFSVSYTTRKPREGEKHGREYYFVTEAEFKKMVTANKFIENCIVHGNMYGTAKAELERIAKEGKICVLDIDVQGAQKVYKAGIDANFMFIYPPTRQELVRRLEGRKTETKESLKIRTENAMKELEFGSTSTLYKYRLINDDKDKAYEEMKNILKNAYEEEFNGKVTKKK